MVNPRDLRTSGPERSEKWHAIPNFHDPIASAVTADDLAHDGIRENPKPSAVADHPVTVASSAFGVTLGVRGAQSHFESSLSPELEDSIGMKLRTSGLDVDEIAPRENVYAPKAGLSS
jgi:hypothetical protein